MGDVVEGDERAPKPDKIGRMTYQGMAAALPGITRLISNALPQYAKASVATARKVAPQEQQLAHQLYKEYAPKAANVQNRVADIAAKGDLDRFTNFGLPAVGAAENMTRAIDPEFYSTRANLGSKFQELLNNPISEGELEAMARGMRKMNIGNGVGEVSNNTTTAANAMLFGEGARRRNMENLSLVSGAMPGLRTTTAGDVFGMGNSLGKTYNPNLFARDSSFNEGGFNIGNNLLSGLFGTQNTAMNVNANRRTVSDHVGQAWQQSGLGQATAGGFGCYVAREVFGIDNSKWIMFRSWLHTKAPNWFKKLYLKYGKQFANYISDKPRIKYIIKLWMERRIK
jgi:hypothetical protein